MMNNLFNKKEVKILNKEELEELKNKVKSRRSEVELRREQFKTEAEYASLNKKSNFDPEKLKKWLIAGVAGIFIAIIIWKVIGKFI